MSTNVRSSILLLLYFQEIKKFYISKTDSMLFVEVYPFLLLLYFQKHQPIGYKCTTVAACKYLWKCAVEQQFFFTYVLLNQPFVLGKPLNKYIVLLQTVKTLMKCSIMLHFIKAYTFCKGKKRSSDQRIQYHSSR